jgi:hypothetical protein
MREIMMEQRMKYVGELGPKGGGWGHWTLGNMTLAPHKAEYPPSCLNTSQTKMESERLSPEISEDEEANAMAAMMGFAAFGSQKPPAKKRKFNPTTDAFVEGQALAKDEGAGREEGKCGRD